MKRLVKYILIFGIIGIIAGVLFITPLMNTKDCVSMPGLCRILITPFILSAVLGLIAGALIGWVVLLIKKKQTTK